MRLLQMILEIIPPHERLSCLVDGQYGWHAIISSCSSEEEMDRTIQVTLKMLPEEQESEFLSYCHNARIIKQRLIGLYDSMEKGYSPQLVSEANQIEETLFFTFNRHLHEIELENHYYLNKLLDHVFFAKTISKNFGINFQQNLAQILQDIFNLYHVTSNSEAFYNYFKLENDTRPLSKNFDFEFIKIYFCHELQQAFDKFCTRKRDPRSKWDRMDLDAITSLYERFDLMDLFEQQIPHQYLELKRKVEKHHQDEDSRQASHFLLIYIKIRQKTKIIDPLLEQYAICHELTTFMRDVAKSVDELPVNKAILSLIDSNLARVAFRHTKIKRKCKKALIRFSQISTSFSGARLMTMYLLFF